MMKVNDSMKRSLGKSHCPINFALESVGDPWSLLVVRDIVYFGKRRFTEFLSGEEGIAPSVLADRLGHLEARGILRKDKDPADGRRYLYSLTEDGLGLVPVLLELAAWSARTDPGTDAPEDWIREVERDKASITALITDTVRAGGSVFVGANSVLAQLGRG